MLVIGTGRRCLLLGLGRGSYYWVGEGAYYLDWEVVLVIEGRGAHYWDWEEVLVIGIGKRCLLLGLERGAC